MGPASGVCRRGAGDRHRPVRGRGGTRLRSGRRRRCISGDDRELQAKLTRDEVDNVDVVPAGFLDYEHRGAAADVVYSRYALHHLPDFWKGVALARIHRALRPGGLLRVWDVVYSFGPHEAEDRLEAWCATGGPDGGDGWSRADYEEHVRDEHSTYTWVFEALAQRAGFHIEVAEYYTDGIFAEYLFRRK